MLQSRGVVLNGNRTADVVTEQVAAPVGTQVLIRTHSVGLCGSDMSLYQGTYEGPRNYPIYFGHEWSGTIEAVGPDASRLRPGDKVTGDCSIFCGACQFCASDKNLCTHIEKFGITMNGASRQYFLQDERYVYQADPAADLAIVALSEPLAVGAHAVRRVAEARPDLRDEKILVLGGGSIGLSCFFALKHIQGCRHVELYDMVESRVQKALEMGAAPLSDVAAGECDQETYGGMYSGRGYHAVFETTAAPAVFNRAIDLVRPLGTIMALGFIPRVEMPLKQITLKAARIMGSMGGTGEFDKVLEFVTARPELAAQMISHQVPFEDSNRAFQLAADRRSAMKVLVNF